MEAAKALYSSDLHQVVEDAEGQEAHDQCGYGHLPDHGLIEYPLLGVAGRPLHDLRVARLHGQGHVLDAVGDHVQP